MTENSFEIPQTMTDCAEQNVMETNAAYKRLTDFLDKSVAMGAMPSVGFKGLQGHAMDFALENTESACTFAAKVSNAKTTQEILTLQARFTQNRMLAFANQTQNQRQAVADTERPQTLRRLAG